LEERKKIKGCVSKRFFT